MEKDSEAPKYQDQRETPEIVWRRTYGSPETFGAPLLDPEAFSRSDTLPLYEKELKTLKKSYKSMKSITDSFQSLVEYMKQTPEPLLAAETDKTRNVEIVIDGKTKTLERGYTTSYHESGLLSSLLDRNGRLFNKIKKSEANMNNTINKELKVDRQESQRQLRILITGLPGSGKSTFLRQLFFLKPDSAQMPNALECTKNDVFMHCIGGMKEILHIIDQEFSGDLIKFSSPQAEANAKLIREIPLLASSWNDEVCRAISQLWSEETFRKRCESALLSLRFFKNATYFFKNMDMYQSPDYFPCTQDTLRVHTTSEERRFNISQMRAPLFDDFFTIVEATILPWNHRLESSMITSDHGVIIFCLDIMSYIRKIDLGHGLTSELDEAIRLLDAGRISASATSARIFLFLTNTDIFLKSFKSHPVWKCSDAAPPPDVQDNLVRDEDAALSWMRTYIMGKFSETSEVIYVHFMSTIDSQNVDFIMRAARATTFMTVV